MDEKRIAQLEAQIETLIEGAFNNIFRRTVSAHDIAREIGRSVDNTLRYNHDGDGRPVAADHYAIYLHPDVVQKLQAHRPDLIAVLAEYIVNLVTQSAYRLLSDPMVSLHSDSERDSASVSVVATHTRRKRPSTMALDPIKKEADHTRMKAQLIVGERTIPLTEPLLNIGRGADNHIVLEDTFISRHHIQLRRRFGMYTLFDVNSRSGTYVNGVRVVEHQLQAGDVIRIGNLQLIYMVEDSPGNPSHTTQSFEPVDPQDEL